MVSFQLDTQELVEVKGEPDFEVQCEDMKADADTEVNFEDQEADLGRERQVKYYINFVVYILILFLFFFET